MQNLKKWTRSPDTLTITDDICRKHSRLQNGFDVLRQVMDWILCRFQSLYVAAFTILVVIHRQGHRPSLAILVQPVPAACNGTNRQEEALPPFAVQGPVPN